MTLSNLKLALASMLAILFVPMFSVVPAFAVDNPCNSTDPRDQALCGACQTTPDPATCGTHPENANQNVGELASKIINVISLLGGIVAVIMIIFGGFRYVTSAGDSNRVSGAKNTIIYAVIGLIIIAIAQFIVRFVLAKV